ncbi:MAG: RhuM protein [Bacteroidales bacterium]|nr:RhuM protein [Bacteroidales bacterium]
MRRIITIDEADNLHLSESKAEVWMTAGELAELFHVTAAAVNSEIKSIRKTGVLNDYEVCKYISLEKGCSVDVYSFEIIIPIAFQLNTYYTHLFRKWIMKKILTEKRDSAYMLIVNEKSSTFLN